MTKQRTDWCLRRLRRTFWLLRRTETRSATVAYLVRNACGYVLAFSIEALTRPGATGTSSGSRGRDARAR